MTGRGYAISKQSGDIAGAGAAFEARRVGPRDRFSGGRCEVSLPIWLVRWVGASGGMMLKVLRICCVRRHRA